MNQENVLHRIRTLLSRFQEEVNIDNLNGEFSINIHAENVLLKMLNVAYDLDLHNVNYVEGKTYPAIDLYDNIRGTAFQITSTGTVEKAVHTLEQCVRNGLDIQFDTLYIYFLKGMNANVKTDNSRIVKAKGNFDLNNIHFIDHAKFYQYLNEINDMEKLNRIQKLLEEQFADPFVAMKNTSSYISRKYSENINLDIEQNSIINDENKPTVFISYNNKSNDYVDELQTVLQKEARIIRYTNKDSTGVRPWESFRKFMKTISQQDFAVLIISKAYLESEACMYEVMELWKDVKDWDNKVMYVVMDDANIYSPIERIHYIKYWQLICDKYIDEIKSVDIVNAGNIPKQIEQYRWFAMNIGNFIDKVADSMNPKKENAAQLILERILLSRQYMFENTYGFFEKLVTLLQKRFRTQFIEQPKNEEEVQYQLQKFLDAQGYKKGRDYERESGFFAFRRTFMPDFFFMKLNSAIEIKLLNSQKGINELLDQMNADYNAYVKLYNSIIFLIYDTGILSDIDQFREDFENNRNVRVIVIKH